ncbi:hypothetical protein LINGRAHAP2_LOCUS11387 [Linum grandiflorum]
MGCHILQLGRIRELPLVTVQIEKMMTTKVSSAAIIFLVTLVLFQTVSARNLLQEDSPATATPESGYGTGDQYEYGQGGNGGSTQPERPPTYGKPPDDVAKIAGRGGYN